MCERVFVHAETAKTIASHLARACPHRLTGRDDPTAWARHLRRIAAGLVHVPDPVTHLTRRLDASGETLIVTADTLVQVVLDAPSSDEPVIRLTHHRLGTQSGKVEINARTVPGERPDTIVIQRAWLFTFVSTQIKLAGTIDEQTLEPDVVEVFARALAEAHGFAR